MSMICPPHSVKMVSTPSALRALATRWPPEMTFASRLFCCSVSSAVLRASALGLPSGFSVIFFAAVVDMFANSPSCFAGLRPRVIQSGIPSPHIPLVQVAEEFAVLLHMLGEAERMLAHQALGEVGIAPLERRDDVQMVDNGAL